MLNATHVSTSQHTSVLYAKNTSSEGRRLYYKNRGVKKVI